MIIDAHTHMGPIDMLGKRRAYIPFMQQDLTDVDTFGPEIMLKSMDAYGIEKSVFFSTLSHGEDYSEANAWTARIMRQYPDRLIGYAFINPVGGAKAVDDLKRCINDFGLKGIKLHPVSHAYQIYGGVQDDLVNPIAELASRFKLPIIIHSGWYSYGHPANIGLLADAFPEATIIIAHGGGTPESFGFGVLSSIQVAKKHKNVFLEISQCPAILFLREFVDRVGADRLVFGSDTPWSVVEIELSKVKALRLSEEQERLVLGGNMARILGL